jgi:hypothetical protein
VGSCFRRYNGGLTIERSAEAELRLRAILRAMVATLDARRVALRIRSEHEHAALPTLLHLGVLRPAAWVPDKEPIRKTGMTSIASFALCEEQWSSRAAGNRCVQASGLERFGAAAIFGVNTLVQSKY